ncbi:MAG: gliding motility-associated C-terminal domain-containing protein, partial [Flavobacteriales bacterium]|nr:gliding motility-associated C-terminal domain-containing protein [Flavobacteriales bacterium]
TLTACSNDGTTDLITLLGTPDAGGTWYGPSALANGDQGTFDPGTNAAGTYLYVVTGTAPCGDDTAQVVVTINTPVNAGVDSTLSICSSAAPVDLFNYLGVADNGGTWSGPSALANGDLGTFDPGTNTAGTYMYIVTGTAPCTDDTALVVVTITANDDPTFTYPDICAGAGGLPGTINTPGGTFSFNPDPGDGATINPTTGAISNEVGGSTYSVQYITPAGPCQDSLTITVNILTAPNAGSDNTLNACSSDGTTNLITLLGGADAGGTWSGPSALANGDQGTFDPGTNASGTYLYIINSGACGSDTAQVIVTVNTAPNAGTNGSVTLCDTDPAVDLFNLLGSADLGGSWSPALTSGTGVFDPSVDAAGTYTYTVTGTAPCGNASATVVVTIDNSGCTVTPTEYVISNLLTPNGDGKNDTWIITNVELLDGATVMIFNRWGTKLYETTSYQNDWNGTYNGQDLPDGAYYYVIELNGEVIQGPLTLLRTK